MARPPPEDPRVTDLRRYKQEKETARRKPPPRPPGSGGLLGTNPRAKLILTIVALVVIAIWVLPLVIPLVRLLF